MIARDDCEGLGQEAGPLGGMRVVTRGARESDSGEKEQAASRRLWDLRFLGLARPGDLTRSGDLARPGDLRGCAGSASTSAVVEQLSPPLAAFADHQTWSVLTCHAVDETTAPQSAARAAQDASEVARPADRENTASTGAQERQQDGLLLSRGC